MFGWMSGWVSVWLDEWVFGWMSGCLVSELDVKSFLYSIVSVDCLFDKLSYHSLKLVIDFFSTSFFF